MLSDEDIVKFLVTWGSSRWAVYGLGALLLFLIWVNYKLWRRLQKQKRDAEVLVEWTDMEDEVEVRMTLPKAVTKKDINVQVSASTLAIRLNGTKVPVLEGKLFRLVKSSETHWYIDDRVLKVTLTKQVEKTWKKLWDPDAASSVKED